MIVATYSSRMTKNMHQIRLSNLQRLIDDYPTDPGNRAAFCRAYGLDPLQVGQYFTGGENGRNIGERKARAIEGVVGLDAGWMDRHDSSKSASTHEKSVYLESKIEPKTPQLDLVYVTREEMDILTNFRQSTENGREILSNMAKNIEKDQAKLKKLSKRVS